MKNETCFNRLTSLPLTNEKKLPRSIRTIILLLFFIIIKTPIYGVKRFYVTFKVNVVVDCCQNKNTQTRGQSMIVTIAIKSNTERQKLFAFGCVWDFKSLKCLGDFFFNIMLYYILSNYLIDEIFSIILTKYQDCCNNKKLLLLIKRKICFQLVRFTRNIISHRNTV